MSGPMSRIATIGLFALIAAASGTAGDGGRAEPLPACLSSADAADAVTAHRVVAPGQALGLAKRAVPDSDVLRAALCRDTDALVYRITVLRHDGRVVRVTVDAPSGKVKTVH